MQLKREVLISILLALLAISQTSCVTLLRGKPTKSIPIYGVPEGAKVFENGNELGEAPLVYTPSNRKNTVLTIAKEEYEPMFYTLDRKVSPGWVLTGLASNFITMWLTLPVDARSGALTTFRTDSVVYALAPKEEAPNRTTNESEIFRGGEDDAEMGLETQTVAFEQVLNPTIELRSGARQVLIQPNAAVTVYLKNGRTIKSAIKSIGPKSFQVHKSSETVNYSDISGIRIFNRRRWYPTLLSFAIVPPIIWWASSKHYSNSANDCKYRIQTISTIDYVERRAYGRPQAQCK